jgi:polysaccharide deacetylase 2 family uncharacterized protein YibQ
MIVRGKRRLPRRQRPSSFRNIALLTMIPIAGVLLFFAWRWIRSLPVLSEAPVSSPSPVLAKITPVRTPAPHRAVQSRPASIVLILDDIGFDHQPLDAAMRIDPNINFSILPNAPRAGEFARLLNARGFEVLCHLPMEPLDYPRESPGPDAIMTSMSNDQIAETTRLDVAAIPYARGVNNHMGSRATRDRRVMTIVLSSLPKGLYFIDSRTVSGSVAESLARRMKIPTTGRDVFLDDVQNEQAVRHQLRELVSVAQERGSAVGIGHIHPVTVKVLREEIPNLRTRGVRLIRASSGVD